TVHTGGGGSIHVSGGVSGQLPAFCMSANYDKNACDAWIRVNGRVDCTSGAHPEACMGDDYHRIRSRYEVDCVNCGAGGRQQHWTSGVAEILGAIAPPLAHLGSAYFGARAYERGQEAWAGAAAVGFEQCQLHNNNYLQYLQANEMPGLTPEQQAAMGCNG